MVLDCKQMGIFSVNNIYAFAVTNMVTLQNFEIILITFKVLWYRYRYLRAGTGTCTYA